MLLSPLDAYSKWSTHYDAALNPVTALESRVLAPRLEGLCGRTFLDAGCGTGRWMAWAEARGLFVAGIDRSPEMAGAANRKRALGGRCLVASLRRQPFAENAFDTAVCSFTLGYLPDIPEAMRELARVAGSVVISDIHPAALARGWKRGFRAGGESWEIEHNPYSLEALDDAAAASGLKQLWRMEPPFGEPEREIFEQAGKASAFEGMTRFPAIVVTAWTKLSA